MPIINKRFVPDPTFRALRVFAFDPSLDTELENAVINRTTISVPWENLSDGPIGEYLEVIDVDPASNACYAPVDLNDPYLLVQDGLDPAIGNPQFHQQMVYAVAMTTIRKFEEALGRPVFWSANSWDEDGQAYVQRLRIYPHAMRYGNAYYSPRKKALLFGYFPATDEHPDKILPGGLVFTCLSHDIIAHEMTHALMDGLRPHFITPSNPDVLALHEAFADIVALFQHFSYPESLRHQLARTRGDLASENLLAQLAQQFGQAIGNRGALRDALGKKPDALALNKTLEPHDRGAILVAAVFDAFLLIYKSRTADLMRIASQGTGVLPEGDLHPDLIGRLAEEAAKASRHVLRICIRAIDYLPPVDVTIGEYLRALITADQDMIPRDDRGYRIAFIEAFRRRGIYPDDVLSLSESSLRWKPYSGDGQEKVFFSSMRDTFRGSTSLLGLSQNRRTVYLKSLQLRKELQDHFAKYIRPSGPDETAVALGSRQELIEALQNTGESLKKIRAQRASNEQKTKAAQMVLVGYKEAIQALKDGPLESIIVPLLVNLEKSGRQLEFGHQANIVIDRLRGYLEQAAGQQQERAREVIDRLKTRAMFEQLGLVVDETKAPKTVLRDDDGAIRLNVLSVRTARKVGLAGETTADLVVEIIQERQGYIDPERQKKADQEGSEVIADFSFWGGITLLIDQKDFGVRFAIRKSVASQSDTRLKLQRSYLQQSQNPSLRATYLGANAKDPCSATGQHALVQEPFALLHSINEWEVEEV